MGNVLSSYSAMQNELISLQLLGHIDMDTREWSDGVLTYAARQVVKEPVGMYHMYHSC